MTHTRVTHITPAIFLYNVFDLFWTLRIFYIWYIIVFLSFSALKMNKSCLLKSERLAITKKGHFNLYFFIFEAN